MPRSIARFSAASALSSSWYMRKRLPHPNARIETLAPVRPRVRERSGSTKGRLGGRNILQNRQTRASRSPQTNSLKKVSPRELFAHGLLRDEIGTLPLNLAQPGGVVDRYGKVVS